jgi:hypothetical protein
MNRRGFVGALVVTPLLAWAGNLLAKGGQFTGNQLADQSQFPVPGSTPPGTPESQPGIPGIPPGPGIDPRMVLVYHQKELKKDVSNLYDLARKLRTQVYKTDSTEVLSLDMLHTAQKIQNLAKHIQDLARG